MFVDNILVIPWIYPGRLEYYVCFVYRKLECVLGCKKNHEAKPTCENFLSVVCVQFLEARNADISRI